MTNYLITGAGGQLGNSFQSVATEFYQLQLFFPTQSEVDINKPKTLSNYYKKFPFEGIINCAAYTKVDQAETKYKEAYHINAQGLQNLIKFASNFSSIWASILGSKKAPKLFQKGKENYIFGGWGSIGPPKAPQRPPIRPKWSPMNRAPTMQPKRRPESHQPSGRQVV